MIPATHPTFTNPFNGFGDCKISYLSSVSGLVAWTDYIPVQTVTASSSIEGRTEATGYQNVHPVGSTGNVAWTDYIPVYEDATKTVPWSTDADGYIPVGMSEDGVLGFLSQAEFQANLTHSLVLDAGTGSPTFTRATTATVQNNDGYLVTALAGEARFEGARRIHNLISTSSEDMPNYSNNNTTVSASSEAISGVASTYDIYETAATGIHTRNRLFPALAGHKYVCSVRAKAGTLRRVMIRDGAVTGAASTFDLVDGVVVADEAGGVGSIESTEDAGVYLLSMTFTAPADGNYSPYIYLMRDGTAGNGSASYAGNVTKFLTVGGVQVEDVTAQTTQTAGEYVSVGVASSPYYHGSMVDGVKCFATDINGAAIPSTTLLGYQAEGARTNLCLQSNAFTTTWTDAGAAGNAVQNVVGPDGATSAWTFTDASAVNYGGKRQTFVVANDSVERGFSIFVKKTSGATTFPGIALSYTGGTPAYGSIAINTNTGTLTTRTGESPTNSSIVTFNADFWRVFVSRSNNSTGNTALTIDVLASVNADASATWSAATQGSAVFYGAQLESAASFASSYIPTTTIAVARNADVLTYSSAGNYSATVGWISAEYSASGTNANARVVGDGDTTSANTPLFASPTSGSRASIYDGTISTNTVETLNALNTIYKGASTWGGSAKAVSSNGVTPVSGAFDGNISLNSIGIGVGGSVPWYGTIRNVRIGQRALSSSELQAVTA